MQRGYEHSTRRLSWLMRGFLSKKLGTVNEEMQENAGNTGFY
jgi:hypothetical protein